MHLKLKCAKGLDDIAEDEEDGVMEDDSSDSIDPLRVREAALSLPPKGLDSPYLLKRMSGTSGALFYQVERALLSS